MPPGRSSSPTQPVFVPFQGALTVTLPEGTELVEAPDAMLATDEQGQTVVRWNLSLFPPVSTPIQTVAMTIRSDRAGVPGATVVLTPAGSDQDPATGFSADLLAGANDGNAQLYEGLAALDAAAGQLAEGSDQLAAGLAGLAGGASSAAGASESLAEGVEGLAAGAGTAADASASLASGVGRLADGADEVAAGSEELAGALGQAATGAQDLAEATAALAKATSGSPADQMAPLLTGGAQIEAGLLAAAARIGGPADPVLDITRPLPPDGDEVCPAGGTAPPDDDCVTIYQGVRALRDGLKAVDEVVGKLEGRVDEARDAFADLVAALSSIKDDVTEAAGGAQELYDSLCVAVPPATGADPGPGVLRPDPGGHRRRRVRPGDRRWRPAGHRGPRGGHRCPGEAGAGSRRGPRLRRWPPLSGCCSVWRRSGWRSGPAPPPNPGWPPRWPPSTPACGSWRPS